MGVLRRFAVAFLKWYQALVDSLLEDLTATPQSDCATLWIKRLSGGRTVVVLDHHGHEFWFDLDADDAALATIAIRWALDPAIPFDEDDAIDVVQFAQRYRRSLETERAA